MGYLSVDASGSGAAAASPTGTRSEHPGNFTYWQHYFMNFPKSNNATYYYHPFFTTGSVSHDIALNQGDEMGVVSLAATSGATFLYTGYLFNNMNKNQLNVYARVRLPALPNGTDNYTCFVGFSDAGNNPIGAACAVLIADRATSATNWVIRTGPAGATTVDTGVAMSTSWVNLEVRKNEAGTSFTFYINGVLVATRTTNLPSGPLGIVVGANNVAGVGASPQVCFAGYSVKQATPWSWAAF